MQKPIFKIFILLGIFFAVPGFASAGTTNITSCQNLNITSETYVLQNDVVSDETCFHITAANVAIDLGGHTITYDNQTPLSMPNGSFEDSSLSGTWDLSGGSTAELFTNSAPYAYNIADGVNGIRIPLPAADQYIDSHDAVTLEANTTYSLSVMTENGNKGVTNNDADDWTYRTNISMSIELLGTSYKATAIGNTERGPYYTHVKFHTGGTPLTGKIRLSITGANSGGVGYIYFDDVRILKAQSHAIQVGGDDPVYSGDPYAYVYAPNATITNGTIVQGQGGGFYAHAIEIGGSSSIGMTITNLTATTSGSSSNAIHGKYLRNSTINHNTFYNNMTVLWRRDYFEGATILIPENTGVGSYNSTIYTNIFIGGPQNAIVLNQTDGQIKNQIYDNDITLQSIFSNDFAIVTGGTNTHDNRIHCGSGNNSCRGIHIDASNTIVNNNTIDVQSLPRNREYNGCEAWGAYGIQVETSGHSIFNNVITDNIVTATTGVGICQAHAFREDLEEAVGDTPSANNLIQGNTFTAISTGTGWASSVKLQNGKSFIFNDNTMQTNYSWISIADSDNVIDPVFTNNRWETTGTINGTFYPFQVWDWNGIYFSGTFHCNTYGTGDQARFESGVFVNPYTHNPAAGSSFSVDSICSSDTTAPSAPSGLAVM